MFCAARGYSGVTQSGLFAPEGAEIDGISGIIGILETRKVLVIYSEKVCVTGQARS